MNAAPKAHVKNKYFGVKRRFEDRAFVNRIYLWLAAISVLVLGYFGVFNLFNLVQSKRMLEKRLIEINTLLESNVTNFSQLKTGVLANASLLDNINVYMPATPSTEKHITQLSEAVSKAGFVLRNATASVSSGTERGDLISIMARVDGPGDPVDLVNRIERLKRITRINAMTYTLNTHSSVKGHAVITLDLEIYKAGVN